MKPIPKEALLLQLQHTVNAHRHLVQANFCALSEATLLAPATNGGWSIAQCLEHLNRYGRYYLPALLNALNRSADTNAPTFTSTWLGNYFTQLMKPGAKSKAMEAPKDHLPAPVLNPTSVLNVFLEQQEQLLSLLESAARKDLTRIRIPISISRFLKLRAGDVLGFVIAHNERHVQQALRHIRENKNA